MRVLVLAVLAAITALSVPDMAAGAPDYVGSDACVDCHTAEEGHWAGSHHARAWTEPTAENIRADFNGTRFDHDGMTTRFRIDADGRPHATVTEKDGSTRDYPVHSVVGVEPLQQYLLETGPGRLQGFDVVWDTRDGGWFHLYPDQDLPPDDGLHWTGPYKTWNARCAECHATGYDKGFDARSDRYTSTQVEIGVGCEACHGGGSDHVAWAQRSRPDGAEPPTNHGFPVDFSDTEATIQQCAGCHSRREALLAGNPPPGTPFHDAYTLALLRPGLYHADGQIQDEVYVYGSFLQSKMSARGVSCLDCHDAHTAEPVAHGNAVCTQCHNPAGNADFPSLQPAAYDDPAHHFHEPGSAGARCVSCHMIERVYMGNDGRRDHSFRIPRPDLAAATGAPDACTDCHDGRTPEWAADRIGEWYPDSANRAPHYGEVLARARRDPGAAAEDLVVLAFDQARPGIARATALWHLGQVDEASIAERIAPLLRDQDPLVRAATVSAQRMAPPDARAARLVEALEDPVSTVRLAAARAMLDVPLADVPATVTTGLRRAMGAFQAMLGRHLDFPETHLKVGGMALAMRNVPAAQAAFRQVIDLDPQHVEAWVMLIRLAHLTGGQDAARRTARAALADNPSDETLRRIAIALGG